MKKLFAILSLVVLSNSSTISYASNIEELNLKTAGDDLKLLEQHSRTLLDLAFEHIDEVGLDTALENFRQAPWKREGNLLHIWGITDAKVDWYDAGHTEYEGVSFDGVPDLNGDLFADTVLANAQKPGIPATSLYFPHPRTATPANGYIICKFLKDDKYICTGGFEDK